MRIVLSILFFLITYFSVAQIVNAKTNEDDIDFGFSANFDSINSENFSNYYIESFSDTVFFLIDKICC